jgi:pre-rRNA-processing protein TSR4
MAAFDSDSDSDSDPLEHLGAVEDTQLGFLVPDKEREAPYVELFWESDWSTWDGGKVGGRPAWLHPTRLPSPDKLACAHCRQQMVHLLHLYCPLDADQGPEDAFHRVLYVFTCRNRTCLEQGGGSLKALRCQLPRDNAFFPDDAAHGDAVDAACSHTSSKGRINSSNNGSNAVHGHIHPYRGQLGSLCAVCGCAAPLKCGGCGHETYCSKEHQRWHWKTQHKRLCARNAEVDTDTDAHANADVGTGAAAGSKVAHGAVKDKPNRAVLFPQFELAVEEEVLDAGKALPAASEAMLKSAPVADTASADDVEGVKEDDDVTHQFEEAARGAAGARGTERKQEDKTYKRFMQRVRMGGSDQVLRYCRWTEQGPLLVHSTAYGPQMQPAPLHAPPTPPPGVAPCVCGAPRRLEFQVMPQLLHFLEVGGGTLNDHASQGLAATAAIDWGSLDVWTCTASCSLSSSSSSSSSGDATETEADVYVEEVVTRQMPVPHVGHHGGRHDIA